MRNMNNELEGLQAAIKACEQLAPHANSIQQIQKICNELKASYPQYVTAQAAFAKQLPSLEQAFDILPPLNTFGI